MSLPADFTRMFHLFTHPWECGVEVARLRTCQVTRLEGDRGGRTIHGIAEAFHPEAYVGGKIPSIEEAMEILHASYWMPAQCNSFSWPLNAVVFDFAMNHGEDDPAYTLQVLTGHAAEADGDIGPITARWVTEWIFRGASLELIKQREMLAVRTRWKKGLLARCEALRKLVLSP